MTKRELKKIEIIRNSFQVMYENGYNHTGVKDLTDAAGIPKGSLYNYFSSKEEYAGAAIDYYFHETSAEQFAILEDKSLAPLERIKAFYGFMIDAYGDETSCKFGCFVGNLTQEMGGQSVLLSRVTDEIHTDIVGRIRDCLAEALRTGDLQGDKDIDVLADFIVSSWQGALLRIKASRKKEVLDHFFQVLTETLLV